MAFSTKIRKFAKMRLHFPLTRAERRTIMTAGNSKGAVAEGHGALLVCSARPITQDWSVCL